MNHIISYVKEELICYYNWGLNWGKKVSNKYSHLEREGEEKKEGEDIGYPTDIKKFMILGTAIYRGLPGSS
jgi:hypothetical protein